VRKGDSTLAFPKGSHQYHRKFAKQYNLTDKSDWLKLNKEQVDIYINTYNCPLNYVVQRIKCPSGSLVLWDSRLIHCGQQPVKERAKQNFRFCIYVCSKQSEIACVLYT
jgi:ectoine hydroxylase-related dioxygenase (phytanoyl-CoA dioxygenase family)